MSRRLQDSELANPTNDAERNEALLRLKSLTLTGQYRVLALIDFVVWCNGCL